jgi:hypothetical protein
MSERIRQSPLLRQAIAETDNRLATQTLFATVLGREPDPQELQHATAYLEARRDARQRAMESLLWSLLASAEFYINH